MKIIIDELAQSSKWIEVKHLTLEKPVFFDPDSYFIEISQWCEDNNCGRRTAYNQFKFKNRKQLNWFLLKWES